MSTLKKLGLGACLFFLGLTCARASEKRVKLADLPPAVQKTVKEQSKGATIRGYLQAVENGKTTYEVAMTVNGHGKDVSMDATGAVLEVEEEVPLASIPAAAKQAIEKGAAGGKVLKVEAVSNGSGPAQAYEAQVLKDGKRSEVRVSPDGSPAPEH